MITDQSDPNFVLFSPNVPVAFEAISGVTILTASNLPIFSKICLISRCKLIFGTPNTNRCFDSFAIVYT